MHMEADLKWWDCHAATYRTLGHMASVGVSGQFLSVYVEARKILSPVQILHGSH